jgi:hypothetical protein
VIVQLLWCMLQQLMAMWRSLRCCWSMALMCMQTRGLHWLLQHPRGTQRWCACCSAGVHLGHDNCTANVWLRRQATTRCSLLTATGLSILFASSDKTQAFGVIM